MYTCADATKLDYFRLYYADLVRMAAGHLRSEGRDHILNPTDLVHELWLRMNTRTRSFQDGAHFLATCRLIMRHILTDCARSHKSIRRGHGKALLAIDAAVPSPEGSQDESQQCVRLMVSALEAHDLRLASVVRLRFFSGLTESETANSLGVTRRTVSRDWNRAKAWLSKRISAVAGKHIRST